MRKLLLALGILVAFNHMAAAGEAKNEIHWISIEEAEAKMKVQPRKVIVDVYTAWCGWCKVMDKKTYSNDSLISYVNEHYYAVKLDAEQRAPITFHGKKWEYSPQQKVNALAVELLRGSMSYPTTVFMDENFESPQPIPGYQETYQMESILKYLGGNNHKTTPWSDWMHGFKPSWGK